MSAIQVPVKVLFGTFRYHPTNLDDGSGFDHDFYMAFKRNGVNPEVIGPFPHPDARWENFLSALYKKITGLSYSKFRISGTWALSSKLNEAVARLQPDVVFTIWPNFLVFYRGKTPVVYFLDTCLYGQQLESPTYGKLAMIITEWQEQKAFNNATMILTHSNWSKNVISRRYGVSPERILVFPVSSSLPAHVIPDFINIKEKKQIKFPLRLLLVGRVYHRKGVDIAIETAGILNKSGIPTVLTVCGLQMSSELPYVRFVGPFRKSDPGQLQQYAELYEQAHFLIHPARFEPAGIVPSEAAAFATPTITNDVGGLGTTVAHDVSGIVLPRHSPAELYAQKIVELVNAPEHYYQLCQSTRQRYERELNWNVTGPWLVETIRQVVKEHNGIG
jgi:glycosyltransferase involved in cell wall biosynthesis